MLETYSSLGIYQRTKIFSGNNIYSDTFMQFNFFFLLLCDPNEHDFLKLGVVYRTFLIKN